MEYNKINPRAPQKVEDLKRSQFIQSANEPPSQQISFATKEMPWDSGHFRDDVQKAFTVKLPEKYIAKLKYINEMTNQSQQRVVREAVCKEVDRILKGILQNS